MKLLSFFKTTYQSLTFILHRAREERLAQVAGSLTFTTTLAIVPLITVGFALITKLPIFEHMQVKLHELLLKNLMPEDVSEVIFNYLDLFSTQARSLTLIGLGFLAITALSMMLTIDHALNTLWRVEKPRPFAQRLIIYGLILTCGPCLLSLSVWLSSYLASASAGLIHAPPISIKLFIISVPLALLILGYWGMYFYIPKKPVGWKNALIGGLCAAIAFEAAKRGFAIYIARFPTYTTLYGPLAALPIFLLWIYLSWYITLFGAIIAASLPALTQKNMSNPGGKNHE